MFFRESERRSKGMWMYSVKRITDGAWIESFWEWSMWPLCSSTRATPLKIMTTARLSVQTLMGSKEVLRTKTLPFISLDITRARKRVSKLCGQAPVEICVNCGFEQVRKNIATQKIEQVRKRGLPPLLEKTAGASPAS